MEDWKEFDDQIIVINKSSCRKIVLSLSLHTIQELGRQVKQDDIHFKNNGNVTLLP